MHWIKKRDITYANGDKEILEAFKTNDQTFRDGIKFNLLYLSYNKNEDKYEKEFAIDNSHGTAHIHKRERKDVYIDYDWKVAVAEFDKMVLEYRKRKGV